MHPNLAAGWKKQALDPEMVANPHAGKAVM